METMTFSPEEVDALFDQLHRARLLTKPGTELEEYTLISRAADGRLKVTTGTMPRGFRPQKLKKTKKKPTTTRRPHRGKKR